MGWDFLDSLLDVGGSLFGGGSGIGPVADGATYAGSLADAAKWPSEVGGWFSRNESWLKPTAQIGSSIFQNATQNQATNNMVDFFREQEDRDYQQQAAERSAYLDWMQRSEQARQGAAAAAAKYRREAGEKAYGMDKKQIASAMKRVQPYEKASLAVLPLRQGTYTEALKALAGLQAQGPLMQARAMAPSRPAYSIDMGL